MISSIVLKIATSGPGLGVGMSWHFPLPGHRSARWRICAPSQSGPLRGKAPVTLDSGKAGRRGSRLGVKEVPPLHQDPARGAVGARFADWAPPVAWMGVMFWLSTDAGSAQQTSRLLMPVLTWLLPGATHLQLDALHVLTRKAAHVTEYAILAALWFRALVRGHAGSAPTVAWGALAISVAWAFADEAHQSFVISRTASLRDVAIDSAGVLAVVLVRRPGLPAAAGAGTARPLGTAAVGGVLPLVLNLSVGLPSGVLWVTGPAPPLPLLLAPRPARAS